MSSIATSKKQVQYIWMALPALIVLYTLPVHIVSITGTRLDDSWIRAINMALNNGAVFGKDFIFPYGPLGFLETRNSHYLSIFLFVLFDLVLLAGYYMQLKAGNKNLITCIYLLLAFFLLHIGNSYSIKLFILYIIVLSGIINNRFNNLPLVVFAVLLAFISLLVKVNYGLIAFILLALAFVLSVYQRPRAAWVLALAVVVLGIVTLSVFNIYLPGYLTWSFPLIQGYNEAMYVPIRLIDAELTLALADLCLFAGVIWMSIRRTSFNIANIFLFSLLVFLLFKNSFVRADAYHKHFFYCAFPVVLLFFAWRSKLPDGLKTRIIVAASILISCIALLYSNKLDIQKANPLTYFRAGRHELGIREEDVHVKIPTPVLKRIGKATVDIFPIDITIAEINRLNYKGRPVIQSYSAYTPSLDSLNAGYFQSAGRPSYLIVRNFAIDGRYAVWDEALTKIYVRHYYQPVDSFHLEDINGNPDTAHYFLLLEKKNISNDNYHPVFTPVATVNLKAGIPYQLDFDKIQAPVYMNVTRSYDITGEMAKIIFQPPVAEVKLKFEDGSDSTCKFIASIANTPLLINKAVRNNQELCWYLSDSLSKNSAVQSIEFMKRKGWKEDITVSFFSLAR